MYGLSRLRVLSSRTLVARGWQSWHGGTAATNPELVKPLEDLSDASVFNSSSHVPDLHIPPTHFSQLVWSNSRITPNSPYRTAIVDGDTGRAYTYREAELLSRNFASALCKFGAARGDVLALILPNMPEFVFCFTGAPLAGLTVTTIPPTFTHHEMRQQILMSGASWVVTDLARHDTVRRALTEESEPGWGEQGLQCGSRPVQVVVASGMRPGPPGTIPLNLMLGKGRRPAHHSNGVMSRCQGG